MKIFIIVGMYMVFVRKAYTTEVQNYTTGINWFNASSRCGRNGLVYDLPTLSNNDDFKNGDFWTGIIQYKVVTPWIEPIGCFRYKKIEHTTYNISSIGLCQQKCSLSQHFGYQESTHACRCFNCDDFSANTVNLSNCQRGILMNDFTIVYRRFNLTKSTNEEKKCMVSTCKDTAIELFASECDKEDSAVKAVCDDLERPVNVTVWGLSYEMAKRLCLQLYKTLLSPRDCPNTSGIFTWTSVFREEIVAEYNKEQQHNIPAAACLSGRRNASEPQGIKITQRPCDTKLQLFACRPNLHEETPSLHTDDKKCDIVNEKFNTSSNTGALIGGILGSVITVVFVVSLIVWMRRKNNNESKEDHSNTSRHESNNVQHTSNLQYDQEEEQRRSLPEYAVVEKKNKDEDKSVHEYAVVNKQIPATSEDTYAIASDEQYDKLNNVVSRKMVKQSNVYGILGQSVEGEYDTTNAVSASNVKQTNDLYDASISMCSLNQD